MCCHWTMCQIIIGQCVQLSLDNVSNNHVNVRQDFFALAIVCPIFFHLNLILSNQMWFVRHRRCQRCQFSGALVQGVYRIKEVLLKRLRVVDIVYGIERTLPTELARQLNIENLVNIKYSLLHQYTKSHFNRLMYNNRYIGPSEQKYWQNMIQQNASGTDPLPTCASRDSSIDDTQPSCEPDEGQLEDPDNVKKTRSGMIYLANTTEIKSILKSSSSSHHGQDILIFQSPSQLAAHKKGLRQSLETITPEQKKILAINPGNLEYCSLKQWSQPSPRTGKNISGNPIAQVKSWDTVESQPLNYKGNG